MSYIETNPLKNSTILKIYSERGSIRLEPPYQRFGDIWTLEKKRLLIDSILNDYDIPKIYFHIYSRQDSKKTGFSYAVIDGRQRLETIWQFIDGKFTLDSDFKYLADEGINLSSLNYNDISTDHPKIRIDFDSFVLPIVGVVTDDLDLIEDMFSRLNEAVPLNAAEKRNAFGGDMALAIRDIASHRFFTEKVKFSNKRYQHKEVAARFLLLIESLQVSEKIIDTKKVYLDIMTRNYKKGRKKEVTNFKNKVINVLDSLTTVFSNNDDLLLAQGTMTVYFLLFKNAQKKNIVDQISRKKLLEFRRNLKNNRIVAESNFEKANYDLLEYDRMSQQGTNDASSIKERVRIIEEFIFSNKPSSNK
ncbi:MAG: DUF262 domain-containing protein [Nitrospirota bacterium]